MSEIIRCSRCGSKIKVDDYNIQFCSCGAYYRRSRDFRNAWVFAGWWKGGAVDRDIERNRGKRLYK